MQGFFNISETDTRRIHKKQSELESRTGHRWRVKITEGFAAPRVLHILVDGQQVAHVMLPSESESPVNLVCSALEQESRKPVYLRSLRVH